MHWSKQIREWYLGITAVDPYTIEGHPHYWYYLFYGDADFICTIQIVFSVTNRITVDSFLYSISDIYIYDYIYDIHICSAKIWKYGKPFIVQANTLLTNGASQDREE